MSNVIVRYGKGFRPQLTAEMRARLKAWEKTCLVCRIAETLAYYWLIVLAAVASFMGFLYLPWWLATAGYVASLLMIARQQRVLELFVHDASHYCWDRRNRSRNDLVANILVGWPTMGTVESYRKFHAKHHAYYGSDVDPCKLRLMEARGLIAYAMDWYRQIGSKGANLLMKWAGWHSLVFILPIELVVGGGTGLIAWLAWWFVPMVIVLPLLRRVAESEEHDYDCGNSELVTTYTNLGWLRVAFFHPANDAYHLVHHMWPSIPMRRHRQVHRFAVEHIPEYSAGLRRG
jgi:fatty acid desaturase